MLAQCCFPCLSSFIVRHTPLPDGEGLACEGRRTHKHHTHTQHTTRTHNTTQHNTHNTQHVHTSKVSIKTTCIFLVHQARQSSTFMSITNKQTNYAQQTQFIQISGRQATTNKSPPPSALSAQRARRGYWSGLTTDGMLARSLPSGQSLASEPVTPTLLLLSSASSRTSRWSCPAGSAGWGGC